MRCCRMIGTIHCWLQCLLMHSRAPKGDCMTAFDILPALVISLRQFLILACLHHGICTLMQDIDQERCCACNAGGFQGLKQLNPDSQAVKGCPECRAPISGVLRYGRITNKRTNDLMDSKFAAQLSLSLRQAKEAVQEPAVDPDKAARDGQLDIGMIHAIGSHFHAIAAQSMFLPSTKVCSSSEHV